MTHLLLCLACRQPGLAFDSADATCGNCGTTYPVVRGVIDFRDADRDLSAGYDIGDDNRLAAKLGEVFDHVTTFKELRQLLLAIRDRVRAGARLDDIDPQAVLRDDGIIAQPLSKADAAHGPAILHKIPLYLKGSDLPPLRHGIALEDGSGAGYFIDGFSRQFDQLFVLDLSMALLVVARKLIEERGLTNVTLVCASAEHLPFVGEAFDFVHSNNVIEHVANQQLLVSEAHRVLKPSGLMMLMSPNRYSLYVEPHFRLPGFGFIPKSLSRRIIRRRQNRDISEISLRSLGEVRALARASFGDAVETSFIPRRLDETATGGRLRTLLTASLRLPGIGGALHLLLNKAALGVMPYHVLMCAKQRTAPPTTP